MPQEQLVNVVYPENAEKLEKTDSQDVKADAELQDHVDQWENLVKMVLWDPQENLAHQDLTVNLESKDLKVFKVFQVFRV